MNIQWGNLYDKIFTVSASDSKLAFKQSVLKLCETKDIAADDPFWTSVSGTSLSLFECMSVRKIFL